jgi:hypothetical protein
MENVNEVFEERDQRKGRCSRQEDEELKGPFCVALATWNLNMISISLIS